MSDERTSTTTFLANELRDVLTETTLFEQVDALEGEVFRDVVGRKTFQFSMSGQSYFAKVHYGVGWWEITKNLLQLRLPVIGASNEWLAIRKLHSLGVDTMEAVAYVNQGWNPARRQSCLVTKDLQETISLEYLVLENRQTLRLKRALTERVACVANTLHENGINHRDFYLCHFLLPLTSLTTEKVEHLFLIDLHRAQIRSHGIPDRWREKDLAGLLFSAADANLTQRDLLRFVKTYAGGDLRAGLKNKTLWRQVVSKANKLYLKDHGAESSFLRSLEGI